MENVDRIVPTASLGSSLHLRVSESNKDGGKQHPPDSGEQPHPHDVLELHDEEVELEVVLSEESDESSMSGLDLAV